MRLLPVNMGLINTYAFLVGAVESVPIYALRMRAFYVREVACAIMERFAIIAVYVTVGELVLTTIIVLAVKSVRGRPDAAMESSVHHVRHVTIGHTVPMENYEVYVLPAEEDRDCVNITDHVLYVVLVTAGRIVPMKKDEAHVLSVLTGAYANMERKKANVRHVGQRDTANTIN